MSNKKPPATLTSTIRNASRRKLGGFYAPTTPAGGWFPFSVREPFAGAWQNNIEWKRESVLAFHAVFACITLIASDISKLRVKLVRDVSGIWQEMPNLGNFNVLGRPNAYQNRIQFFEAWLNSKLIRGNAYILLERDGSRRVRAMYVLNPDLVTPMVTPEGEIFYQLGVDNLSGQTEDGIFVPASEIIHDRFNCLCHPLVGLSPIFACGLAAYNGMKIQQNSSRFFQNMSRPSGILTAPGAIQTETAERLKEAWEENYSSENYGRVAVLGDDLKYEPLSITPEESLLVDQLRLTAEIVCSAFHVPKYKVGGDPPSYNNIEALEQGYYSQCLQAHIESIELLLDEGLGMPNDVGVEFDLDGLLRMDTKTQVETITAAIKGGLDTPNEGRKRRNQKPLPGGDTIWMQEQNWPMEVLAERRTPPESGTTTPPEPDGDEDPNAPADNPDDDGDEAQQAAYLTALAAALTVEMKGVRYDA